MTNNEIETKYSIKYLGELPTVGQIFYSVNIEDKFYPEFDHQEHEYNFRQYFDIKEIKSKRNFKYGQNIFVIQLDQMTNISDGFFANKESVLHLFNQYLIDVNQIKNNIEKL